MKSILAFSLCIVLACSAPTLAAGYGAPGYFTSLYLDGTIQAQTGGSITLAGPWTITGLSSFADAAISDSLYFLRGFGVDLTLTDDLSVDSAYFAGHLRGNKSLYGKDSIGTAGLFYGVNSRLSGWGIFGGTTDTVKSFLTLGGYEAVRIDSDTLYIGMLSDTTAWFSDSSWIVSNSQPAYKLVVQTITPSLVDSTGCEFIFDSTRATLVRSAKGVFSDTISGTTIWLTGGALIGGMTTTDVTGNLTSNNSIIDTLALPFRLTLRGIAQYPAFIDSFSPATTALLCAVPGAAGSDAVSGSIWEAMPLPTDTTAAGVDILPLTVAWNSAGFVTAKRLPVDSTDFKYVKLRCIYRP